MPTRASKVSFANLICRFGDELVLLDLAQEVVLPAFMNTKLRRKVSTGTFFFLDVVMSEIPSDAETEENSPLLVLHGRLVKDTSIARDQFYAEEAGLVRERQSLPSAPTSFFCLILDNHKLLYVPETEDGPAPGAFRETLQKFLGIEYRRYIADLASARGITKKQLYNEIPHPSVDVLPLASKATIEEFVRSFAKLKSVDFKILDTNQEFQQKETFEEIRRMRRAIGSKDTTLQHKSPSGLDKATAVEQIHAAAASGNQKVRLSGESMSGDKLTGDNNQFSLSVREESLPPDDPERAAHLVKIYEDYAQRGIILEDAASADNARRLQRLRDQLAGPEDRNV